MINVEGNINSVEKQLLYDILNELKALREDLKAKDTNISLVSRESMSQAIIGSSNINIPFSDETPLTIDYTSMKRAELIKLVRELENKPKEYVKLSNVKLIELLKEG